MNFKKFNDIGDSEPRAWSHASIGTKFGEEDEEDELPVPYCDEFEDEESESGTDEEIEEVETETETETESITSVDSSKKKRTCRQKQPIIICQVALQEEADFMQE